MQCGLLDALGQTRPVYWYCTDIEKDTRKPFEIELPDLEEAKVKRYGVFFCVNETGDRKNNKGNLRHRDNIIRPLACFADFDNGTLEEQTARLADSPLAPSAFVRSGRGYHVYWFLEGTTKEDLGRWRIIQSNIAHFFGSDEAVNDEARLMRLPGSWHTKDMENPREVILESCQPALRYSLSEMEGAFPEQKTLERMLKGSPINRLFSQITKEGFRNTNLTKIVGSLLAHFPMQDWETKALPLALSWNRTQAIPPDDEDKVRTTFSSIARAELDKRKKERIGVPIYAEDTLEPEMQETVDGIVVREKVEDGIAEFVFSEIEQTRSREIDATLVVRLLIPGSHPKPFSMRLNTQSGSGREGFARMLGKSFGKELPWDLLLSRATESLRTYLSNQDKSLWFEEAEAEDTKMLFSPFIARGPNVFFGKGSSGKTYFSLRLALSYAVGTPFMDFQPETTGAVLFVDYEATPSELKDRLQRLCSGLNPPVPFELLERRFRYLKPETALPDAIPAIRKAILNHGIGLVVVDSAVQACGGEPEKAEVASRYFNALASLGVPSITIAHETKLENHNYPFGSVFFWNAPRNIFNIQCESDEEDTVKQIGIFHRKNNNGPLYRPLALRVTHRIDQTGMEWGDRGIWDKELSLGERVLRLMRDGKRRTKEAILQELGLPKDKRDTLDRSIRRLRSRLKIVLVDNLNGIWALSPPFAGGADSGGTVGDKAV